MVKSIVVLLNLIGLIIFELFYGETVTVKQNVPDSIEINVGDTVGVLINKGDLSGFAKLQQDIPLGFEVDIIDSKGGTFSFKDNVLKIIWISLPTEEEFNVTYLLTALAPEKEAYTLDGKFSYIEQNEKQSVDYSSASIKIGKESTLIADNEASTKEKSKNKQDKKSTKKKDTNSEVSKLVAEGDDFIVYRQLSKIEQTNKLKVEILIEKEEINSFGKIEEFIPLGYTAYEGNSNEGFFSFKNNVVKILWMAMPFGDRLTASYILEKNEVVDNVDKIKGKFSFLKNEETFEADLASSDIPNIEFIDSEVAEEIEDSNLEIDQTKADEIASNLETETDDTNLNEESQVTDEAPIDRNSLKETAIISEDVSANNEETSTPTSEKELVSEITKIPSPETGISYKVQIAAGHSEIAADYFAKKHGIKEQVSTEFHEGWRKYTVGKFPVYKEARDHRNQIWKTDNKISDAFVTAYNQGNRITVQEALMISKQQWFK